MRFVNTIQDILGLSSIDFYWIGTHYLLLKHLKINHTIPITKILSIQIQVHKSMNGKKAQATDRVIGSF